MTSNVAGHPTLCLLFMFLLLWCAFTPPLAQRQTSLLLPQIWPPHLRPPRSRPRVEGDLLMVHRKYAARLRLTNARLSQRL